MPVIVNSKDPINPVKDYETFVVSKGDTIRNWMDRELGEGKEFELPTIAILNGSPILRDDWGVYELQEFDVVNFRIVLGDPISAIVTFIGTYWQAIVTVAALAYSLSLDIPTFGEGEQADPVYFLKGQRNQVKLGEPVQVPYGKNKLFPAFAARRYSKFKNNDQFVYQLFCLGQGEYDIDNHYIGDTLTANYEEVAIEVYEPGDPVTLFPDNVETSSEVDNITLFGPNEPDYNSWVGPFTANELGTETDIIEIDLVFPRGLFRQEGDGSLSSLTVTAEFEYRNFDDGPDDWNPLFSFTKTLAENQVQRFTVSTGVTSGRYEVRGRRTNNAAESTSEIDDLSWFAMRAILPSTKDYGDVTLVAMEAKATNNLNDQTSGLYNVIATRKTEIWNGSTWSVPTANRNPVWAFCDILRSTYGAKLADSKLDLDGLLTLANTYTTNGDNFDWVFDTKTTIWEALKVVARAGRAAPVVSFTEFSMKRDAAQSVPIMAFSPDNIIADSFKWDISLQKPDDYDGIQIEYLDETTWKQETVDCKIGDDNGDRLQNIRLPGIIDRDKAYREGLYIRAQQIFQRETVSFRTGLEGNIPSYGDLIVVSHDMPKWGLAGQVVSIAGDNVTVTVSESLNEVSINSIAFKDKFGQVVGPYSCTKTADNDFEVVTDSAIDQSNMVFDDFSEPPVFFVGESNLLYKELIVTSVSTKNDDTVEITAVNYDERLYDYDQREAEPLEDIKLPPAIPNVPTVTGVTVDQDLQNPEVAFVRWDLTEGADYYIIESSTDNANWSSVAVSILNEYRVILTEPGLIYFRVAAVGGGQGPFSTPVSAVIGSQTRVASDGRNRVTSDGKTRISV